MIKRGPASYVDDGIEYKMTAEEVNDYLDSYLKEYFTSVENITDEEKFNATEWFNKGNDIKVNPWYICDDSGCPMDYISAKRFFCLN